MIKITVVMAITVLAIQGAPLQSPFDDILQAAKSGAWDEVQTLLNNRYGADGWKPVPLDNVRNLKSVEGGHVYGESEFTFHSSSDLAGQKIQDSAGHKIINKDGRVKEFDFKPKFEQNPYFNLS